MLLLCALGLGYAPAVQARDAAQDAEQDAEQLGVQFVLDTFRFNQRPLFESSTPPATPDAPKLLTRNAPPAPALDLYRWASTHTPTFHTALPSPGDLAFFHNTHDRNHNGLWDDWFTWVAIVESTRADGTVTLVGYLNRRVVRLYLNHARPDEAVDAHGQTLNTLLRPDPGPHDLVASAGRLFATFCDPLGPSASQFKLNLRWQPHVLASSPTSNTASP